jgi:AraC-like DNA-binding protein
VGQWLSEVDCGAARVVPRDQGWGRSLSALCLQLGDDPMLAAGYPQALLADQVGAMLAASLEPSAPASSASGELAARAMDLMRERLDAPGLAAGEVAAALGISARSLHRAFAAEGTTFMAQLRGLRMDRAAQLLAQPRLAGVSVAEIGRRCGYGDASHFVRHFQQAVGTTPARWRRIRLSH